MTSAVGNATRDRSTSSSGLAAPNVSTSVCAGAGATTRPSARSSDTSSSRESPGEREAAEVVKGDAGRELLGDELGSRVREEDLPTACQSADARRATHSGAEIVTLFELGLAGVHACAHGQLDSIRPRFAPRARAGTRSLRPRRRSRARTPRACCRLLPESAASDRRALRRSPPRARGGARSPLPSRRDAAPRAASSLGCR